MSTFQIGAKPGTSGTSVSVVEPAPAAVRSPFGSTLMVGGFQWGPINRVVQHNGFGEYRDMRGTAMREDPTPLNCDHWYQMSKGAGRLLTLRLSDGDQAQAYRDVYARNVQPARAVVTPYAPPARAMRVRGLYAGRRGGPLNQLGGVTNLAAAFNAGAGTFTTGVVMV